MPYPEQLARKRQRVIDAFHLYPKLANAEIPPVAPSPWQFVYRARVKLVLRKTKENIKAGLYVPGSHRVIDISSCPVHPEPVNAVLPYLKRKILELGIAAYDERNDTGQLRYLDFCYSFTRREMLVTLVTRHSGFPQGKELARSVRSRFPFVAGVIQNINEQRGNVIWGVQSEILAGSNVSVETVGNLKLAFPAAAFSQANPFTAAKVYEKVAQLAMLNTRETLLDLYCGAGPISLSLAKSARFVWGVDDHPASTAAAQDNARRNGMANCRFVSADVVEGIKEAKRSLRQKIDLIVLNPPRKGVQSAAMEAIVAADASRIIYVSCDPISLTRDLDQLASHNYQPSGIQPFDMFPQTKEVETVVLLVKG
jgi:23S rRNA (uracil1939-C5)-methyltransferase